MVIRPAVIAAWLPNIWQGAISQEALRRVDVLPDLEVLDLAKAYSKDEKCSNEKW